MKKALALLLVLAAILALCACGKGGSAAGTWVLTGFIDGEEDYTQQIRDTGITILLQLNEDGTGYLDYGDRQENFTWDAEGLSMDGIKRLYTLRGNTLSIGYNDQLMTFTHR